MSKRPGDSKSLQFFRTYVIDDLLAREGGLVDDPDDSGGITNYGISFRYLQRLPSSIADVNNDGVIDAADVRGMTREQATAIYAREWHQARYHAWMIDYNAKMPGLIPATRTRLAVKLFDIRINTGPRQAAILLQRATNAWLGKRALTVDGVIGPRTRAAVKPWCRSSELIAVLRAAQIGFYVQIATGNRRKYLDGWINRALA